MGRWESGKNQNLSNHTQIHHFKISRVLKGSLWIRGVFICVATQISTSLCFYLLFSGRSIGGGCLVFINISDDVTNFYRLTTIKLLFSSLTRSLVCLLMNMRTISYMMNVIVIMMMMILILDLWPILGLKYLL